MRELAILTFVTLDGVMQGVATPDEDCSGDFTQGGWAKPYWEGVMAQVKQQAMSMPYDMLFGRKTYDLFAANQTGDSTMDRARKFVVTSTPETLNWNNSAALSGDPVTEVSRLKQEDGPLLQVHGSWQLIQTLFAHGLIDEFRLWTFPVVLGAGKRLFAGGSPPVSLVLSVMMPKAKYWCRIFKQAG